MQLFSAVSPPKKHRGKYMLTDKEEIELLRLLEEERRDEILNDYHLFSAEHLWITDKEGNKVKLEQNHVQKKLEKVMQDLRDKGKPPRVIILKSRQMGLSTDTEGRMVYNTSTKENRNGLVVAHRSDSTQALFAKTKYFYNNLNDDVKPLQQASNGTELIFNEPTHYKGNRKGINSKVKVQTAGKSGIGRSDTFHYVHLSEFAFWEGSDTNSPDKQLTGILQSVPDALDTWVIIESTANGMNDFKTEWDKAVKGESAFYPLFLPWYEHEEYTKSVNDKDYFIQSMVEYERWLYYDLNLSIERVAWWRWKKKNSCNGDLNQMKQENPTTPEEAFIFSGTPVFDNEKIMKRIKYLDENQMYREGYFKFKWNNADTRDYIVDSSIEFVHDKQKNWIRIFDQPEPGRPYSAFGDTKGEGKDYFASSLMDNVTQERKASIHMQMDNSKPFTWQLYCLGRYYHDALLAVEMNFNTAPLEELERLNYPNQYMREKKDSISGDVQRKFGWKTDGITRPLMIDGMVDVVNNYLYLIKDVRSLHEMLTFVYDKNGRPDAMSGEHDDLLICEAGLNQIRGQQATKIEEVEVKKQTLPHALQDNDRMQESGNYIDW